MRTILVCNRCKTNVDVEEGMKIGTCLTRLNSDINSHMIEVDTKTDRGAEIAAYFNRKPSLPA